MVCLIANCLLGWTTISYSENIQNNGVEKLGEFSIDHPAWKAHSDAIEDLHDALPIFGSQNLKNLNYELEVQREDHHTYLVTSKFVSGNNILTEFKFPVKNSYTQVRSFSVNNNEIFAVLYKKHYKNYDLLKSSDDGLSWEQVDVLPKDLTHNTSITIEDINVQNNMISINYKQGQSNQNSNHDDDENTDYGYFISNDKGLHWSNFKLPKRTDQEIINLGLTNNLQFVLRGRTGGFVHTGDNFELYISDGSQDFVQSNISAIKDFNKRCYYLNNSKECLCSLVDLIVRPAGKNIVAQALYFSTFANDGYKTRLWLSSDQGKTWQLLKNLEFNDEIILSWQFDPNQNKYYIATNKINQPDINHKDQYSLFHYYSLVGDEIESSSLKTLFTSNADPYWPIVLDLQSNHTDLLLRQLYDKFEIIRLDHT